MQHMSSTKKWLIFAAIFFVSLNLRPSVTSIGPLVNTIQEQLQVSSTMMSLLTSIPVFCMGLFAPFAVPMQKKFGYRTSVNILMVLIGVATAARFYFDSFAALIITSFLTGFAIAIISPIINAYIKETFKEKMAPVIGIYSFAIGGGASLSAGLTGPFYESTNNWSYALAIWGALVIFALITWTLALEKKVTVVETAEDTLEEGRNPWKSGLAWIIMLYFGLQTALFFSLTAWLPSMGQERGMTIITAGNVLTTMSIVQLVGNLTISSLVGKYPNLVAWLFGLIAFGGVGAGILFIDANWAIWVGSMMLGAALSGLFPIGLMLPLQEARNNHEANTWSSMVLSGGFMLSAILPLIIGMVYDATNSHYATKVIFVILFILMWISIVFLKRAKKRV
jgi:MFS transporter, CP family, cyanate transporter